MTVFHPALLSLDTAGLMATLRRWVECESPSYDAPAVNQMAQLAAGEKLPTSGKVFVSVRNSDKPGIVEVARSLLALGFTVVATRGTAAAIAAAGLPVTPINKVAEGRPHILDMIKNGEIALIFNTPEEKRSAMRDSSMIRRAALHSRIALYTTVAGARAACTGMQQSRDLTAYDMQGLHARILETVH